MRLRVQPLRGATRAWRGTPRVTASRKTSRLSWTRISIAFSSAARRRIWPKASARDAGVHEQCEQDLESLSSSPRPLRFEDDGEALPLRSLPQVRESVTLCNGGRP